MRRHELASRYQLAWRHAFWRLFSGLLALIAMAGWIAMSAAAGQIAN